MRHAFLRAFTVASCLLATATVWARPIHDRHLGHAPASTTPSPRDFVIRDALITNHYGDVVVSGKTGFHRSDFGVMVPDSDPPPFVASGRATGSGFGANGVPGSNQQ